MTYCTKELQHVDQRWLALRRFRRERKITQPELAAMIGIDKDTLCALELGKRRATSRTIEKVEAFSKRWKVEHDER